VPEFDAASCASLVDSMTAIAISASEVIRRSGRHSGVRLKPDGSPVTAADEGAEALIRDELSRLKPTLPIISEEEAERAKPPTASKTFFLVDPLDGTREFISGRDEYTVNIALVSDGIPILGVIVAPARGMIWRGVVGRGAERMVLSSGRALPPIAIGVRRRPPGELLVMVSRSHLDPRTEAYLEGFANVQRVPCGSSLKFCRLAEGAADLYPRLGPTRDWDVAAGHAILAAAGGVVVGPDGGPLIYGTADLRIPAFLAWGDRANDFARHS